MCRHYTAFKISFVCEGEDCNMLSNLAEDEQRAVKRNAVRLVSTIQHRCVSTGSRLVNAYRQL